MATSTREGDDHEDEIRLWREDGWWVAKDVETGVTTQGTSRAVALENLDEAVALHRGEIGHEPTRTRGVRYRSGGQHDRGTAPPGRARIDGKTDVFRTRNCQGPRQCWWLRMAADSRRPRTVVL